MSRSVALPDSLAGLTFVSRLVRQAPHCPRPNRVSYAPDLSWVVFRLNADLLDHAATADAAPGVNLEVGDPVQPLIPFFCHGTVTVFATHRTLHPAWNLAQES